MLKRLLVEKTDHTGIQFLRYGFVAGVAFVIDFGLLFVFKTYVGLNYLLAATLSFSISLVANYALSVWWVFTRQHGTSRKTEVTVFATIGFVGLGFNDLIIWLLTSKLGLFYLVSKLVATVAVFFWSFLARRYLLFKPTHQNG